MSKIFLSIVLIGFSANVYSQSAEDSVKKVINNMFKAMKSSNSEKLLDCFADSALLQTIITSKEGKTEIKSQSAQAFAKMLSSIEEDAADERFFFNGIKIDENLAVVWAPYRFYYKKNFVHCGVNSFQLVRINGHWKIQYLIDTRRRENCMN